MLENFSYAFLHLEFSLKKIIMNKNANKDKSSCICVGKTRLSPVALDDGCVLRVSFLFQSLPQSQILLAIPLNPCCVQTIPSKVRPPSPFWNLISSFYFCFSIFYKLLIPFFIPVSFPRLSNFGNHRLDFLSPRPSLMAFVQFLWFNPDKTSSPL